MQGKETDLKKVLELLEDAIKISLRNDWETTLIGGKYGELYVADKLRQYKPQLGRRREVKCADIYLKQIGKKIEVKWAKLSENTFAGRHYSWGFGYGGPQIRDKKFDFCVLIASDENGKPKHCFIFSVNEMTKLKPRKGGIPANKESYYLTFYEDHGKAKDKEGYIPDSLEKDLNEHPEKYEEQWTKITS